MELGAIITHEVSQSGRVLVDVANSFKDAVLTHVLGGEFIITANKCRQRHRVVHEIDRTLMPIAHILNKAAKELSLGHSYGTVAILLYKAKDGLIREISGYYLLVTSSIIRVVMYSLSMLRIKSGRLW